MTEDECTKLLGEDWKVGNGKVDWFSYQPGKISQEYVLLTVNYACFLANIFTAEVHPNPLDRHVHICI